MMERVVQFGPARGLVGIRTLAAAAEDRPGGRPTWIFPNAGIVHRVGPHRLTVSLARRMARTGFPALRFDLSGVGDSVPRRATSFQQAAIQDLRDAMDHLEQTTQANRFVLCGLCSGADHSVRAALTDPRVIGMALLDPYVYRTPGFYVRRLLRQVTSASSWRTLAKQMRRSLGPSAGAAGPGVACSAELEGGRPTPMYVRPTPERRAFAGDLRTVLDRGGKILVVYSSLEDYTYAEQFQEAFAPFGLSGRVTSEFMPESNHTHTELAQQRRLASILVSWAQQQF